MVAPACPPSPALPEQDDRHHHLPPRQEPNLALLLAVTILNKAPTRSPAQRNGRVTTGLAYNQIVLTLLEIQDHDLEVFHEGLHPLPRPKSLTRLSHLVSHLNIPAVAAGVVSLETPPPSQLSQLLNHRHKALTHSSSKPHRHHWAQGDTRQTLHTHNRKNKNKLTFLRLPQKGSPFAGHTLKLVQ